MPRAISDTVPGLTPHGSTTTVERIDIRADSVADRSDRWEAALRRSYVALSVRAGDGGQRPAEWLRRASLGDMELIDIRTSRCSVQRTKRLATADRDDYVAILVGLSGRETCVGLHETSELSRGDLAFWDPHSPALFEIEDALAKRTLLIPRHVFVDVAGSRGRDTAPVLGGAGGRMLAGYLGVLSRTVGELSGPDLLTARNAMLELLAGLLRRGGPSIPSAAAPVLREQVQGWIADHLAERITPAAAAAAHSVSVRTLHRAFGAGGSSFAGYVRERRLERVAAELQTTDVPVSELAQHWHFTDASHLTRMFHEQFAMPPAEYRRRRRIRGATNT